MFVVGLPARQGCHWGNEGAAESSPFCITKWRTVSGTYLVPTHNPGKRTRVPSAPVTLPVVSSFGGLVSSQTRTMPPETTRTRGLP